MALRRQTPEEIAAWRARSKPLRRGKPLKRGKGPKRKHTAPAKRGRRDGQAHDIITQAEIDAKRRFKQAARDQGVCARCGKADSFDPHHVVEKQWLVNNGFSVIEQYDPDNALRTCDRFTENDCHGKHTRGARRQDRLHLRNLRQENLDYAFRVMGAAAGSYLRRRYRGEDERLDRLEREHE